MKNIDSNQAVDSFASALSFISNGHERQIMQNWFNNHVRTLKIESITDKNAAPDLVVGELKRKMALQLVDSLADSVKIDKSEAWKSSLYSRVQEKHVLELTVLV